MRAIVKKGRHRLLLIPLFIALGGLLVWRGSEVWWWLSHERVWYRAGEVIGMQTFDSGGVFEGPQTAWWAGTGFMESEGDFDRTSRFRSTHWRQDGSVSFQSRRIAPLPGERSSLEMKRAPPWWWGVTDQSQPSAPWLAEGITADEWWKRVRPRE